MNAIDAPRALLLFPLRPWRQGRIGLALLLCGTLACSRGPAEPGGDPGASEAQPARAAADAADAQESREDAPPEVLFAAPEFRLIDQTGIGFGSDELSDHVWIATFIFTSCAATCPAQSARMAEIQSFARNWPDRDRLRLVSFTVDPQRDTVSRLHNYAEQYSADHARWKFLTGERGNLWDVSKHGFKLRVADSAASGSSPIMHSSQFVLIDSESRVRGFYEALADDEFAQLLADVRYLLAEPAGTGPAVETVHIGVPNDVFYPLWMSERQETQLATRDEIAAFHDFQFVDRLPQSGIDFVSRGVADTGRAFNTNHYDHATGIASADVDGDGLYDLYFVNQVGGNELWRNLGSGRFENITGRAGVGLDDRVCVSASFADIDNDGDPDLFVTSTRHGNALFVNDGGGRFHDATAAAGLEYSGHSSAAEFFDYDRDGRLDLFVANVGRFTTDDVGHTEHPELGALPYYKGKSSPFAGHLFPSWTEPSILYRNEGDGRFRDVTERVGLIDEGWTGDATPLDANADGWIDLYLMNMQGNDEYYENIEGQRFERRSDLMFPRPVWGGMGVKSFDYNNDGRMDLFATNMHADMWESDLNDVLGDQEKRKTPAGTMPDSYLQSRRPGREILGNALYENTGDAFQDVSDDVNAENYWPWGPSAGDLNADGFQDLFIASCMNFPYRYHVNSLLLNDEGTFRDAEFILGVEPRRDGRTAHPWFELECRGTDDDHPMCRGRTGRVVVWGALGSRSAVIFDLDNDGDLDIVTTDFNSPPMVLVSDLSDRRSGLRYLQIQLRGTRSNRDGLGATVQVTAGARVYTQVHDGQSGYLSQSSLPLYFGLNDAATVDRIAIQWPAGSEQVLEGPIETNQHLAIVEE